MNLKRVGSVKISCRLFAFSIQNKPYSADVDGVQNINLFLSNIKACGIFLTLYNCDGFNVNLLIIKNQTSFFDDFPHFWFSRLTWHIFTFVMLKTPVLVPEQLQEQVPTFKKRLR